VVELRVDGAVIRNALLTTLVMITLVCAVGPVSSRSIVDLSVRATAGVAAAALSFWFLDANIRQWARSRLRRKNA
jgi:preprotein translocase subunit SecF